MQMTIQQAHGDLRQREEMLQEVNKMRAGDQMGWLRECVSVCAVWRASLTSLSASGGPAMYMPAQQPREGSTRSNSSMRSTRSQ